MKIKDLLLRVLTLFSRFFNISLLAITDEQRMVIVDEEFRRGNFPSDKVSDIFDAAEGMGVHVLPVHFYTPIPDVRTLPLDFSEKPVYIDPGLPFNEIEAIETLHKFVERYIEDFLSLPDRGGGMVNPVFALQNPSINPVDAFLYYAMIRDLKPRRILEVGSGHSTLLSIETTKFSPGTVIDCIEPYPSAFLRGHSGIRTLHKLFVQDVAIEEFDSLQEGDFLFIDGSHVSKAGSDVNFLILKVLPRLRPGVIVHIHDIFLPYEFPLYYLQKFKFFWNEQYVLCAFLMQNDNFRILLPTYHVFHAYASSAQEVFLPTLARLSAGPKAKACGLLRETIPYGGSSFWIKRFR